MRNTPANGLFLGTFQAIKESAAVSYNCTTAELPGWVVMSGAGFGGLLYWLTIYPVDVVKSAMASDTIIKKDRVYTDMVTTTKVSNQACSLLDQMASKLHAAHDCI